MGSDPLAVQYFYQDIRVLKWAKHNERGDVKRPHWFRVDMGIADDPDLYDFSGEEFRAWIYILAMCCRKNSDVVRINVVHAKTSGRIKIASLKSAFKKLERNQSIEQINSPLQTDRQTDKTNKHGPSDDLFFLALEEFLKIPKTVKGSKAVERYRDQIKTSDEHEVLLKSIRNYAAFLAWPENDWRSPKSTFETFLGTKRRGEFWRDFVKLPERGQPPADKQTKSVLDIIKEHSK